MMLNRCLGRVETFLLAGVGVAAVLAWTVAGRCLAAQGEVTPESTPEITSFTPRGPRRVRSRFPFLDMPLCCSALVVESNDVP